MSTLIADYLIKHGATINTGNQYNTCWYDDQHKRYTYYIHDVKHISDKEFHDIICKAYHLDDVPNYITLEVSTDCLGDGVDYYKVYSKTPLTTLEGVDDRQFLIHVWYNGNTPRDNDNLPIYKCQKYHDDLHFKLFDIWCDYMS